MTVSISIHGSLNLDGSIKKVTMDFLDKLGQDPTSPALNVEPIIGSVDPRARTGRVNLQYRAVMFELTDEFQQHFIVAGVYPHDEGIEKAKKIRLDVNPVNGITRLIEETAPVRQTTADLESRRKAEKAAATAHHQAEQEVTVDLPKPRDAFENRGYTPELLEQELGIEPAATQVVMGLDSEDNIEDVLEGSPAWERDALLGIVAGFTIEEIRESLGIKTTDALTEEERNSDKAIIEGLKKPGARMEFAYIENVNTDELRKVIDSGDFHSWRVFIHPDQQAIVEQNFSGAGRVSGGAGTGKTVVVVHRANRLVTSNGATPMLDSAPPRVLLTTFTRGLAESLKSQMNALNPAFPEAGEPGERGLWISGIDALVRKILDDAALSELVAATEQVMGRASRQARVLSDNDTKQHWMDALLLAGPDLSPEIANRTFLSQEFEAVVLANQITTQAAYLRVPRPGRGTSLNRAQRKQVWPLIEAFMKSTARDGQFSYVGLATIAAVVLDNRFQSTGQRTFDHVLIDEAQDFHAGHWKFLRASVGPGANDIFLAEDSHQRIYGQRYVLSRFGIETRGRASRRLTLNYRTTRENLGYALGVLTGEWIDSEGEEDSTHGYRSARSGPLPRLLRFATEGEEISAVAELIAGWQDGDDDAHIGVLTRTRPLINRAVNGLADHGIQAVKTKNAELASREAVSVMTMHGAKGMEFTHVVLLGITQDVLPFKLVMAGLAEAEREEALQMERALLYVAASRARDELVITTHGEPSDLLPA
ncbi:DNA-dependent helicase II [Corynebacterium faecale]|uniref:UvrD-helicase domain-containing protein n=1 Tax=Corynebacterium faecale TaxID=1758466 RepID=UPI0025B462F1|nr:UvrD-helicase domain-containing protein [Corynebacterium faecale]WJY93473.1 DNA-dependent helicase II [Corynebacterium faecale]